MSALDDRVRLAVEALIQADADVTRCLSQEVDARMAYTRAQEATARAVTEQLRARHALAAAEATAPADLLMPAWTPDPVWRVTPNRPVTGQPRVVDVRGDWIVVRWDIACVMQYSARNGWPDAGWSRLGRWGQLDPERTLEAWRSACAARRAGGAL